MKRDLNQIIKCNVSNCKYNNDTDYLCMLKKVDITCTCNQDICNSFLEKNNKKNRGSKT